VEMLSWLFPEAEGVGRGVNGFNQWKKQRLLVMSVWSGNLTFFLRLLLDWGSQPLPRAMWRALYFVSDREKRITLEEALISYLDQRGLDAVEVPLWALVQLGRMRPSQEQAQSASGAQDVAVAMHMDAYEKVEAVLSVQDGWDSVPVSQEVLTAIRHCRDNAAREHFEALLELRLLKSNLTRRRQRAITNELLWELRVALVERRSPNLTLAAELLFTGANPQLREAFDDVGDDDDGDEAGPWVPRGGRFEIADSIPRTTLQLLALNRWAKPDDVKLAIAKAVEFKADPSHGAHGTPLTLAVRSRHAAAVFALLDAGAKLDRQALCALRNVSNSQLRQQLEDRFIACFVAGGCSLTVKDVGLWAAIQCGFLQVATRELQELGRHEIDASVFMALRRCRNAECRKEVEAMLLKHLGNTKFMLQQLQHQAATCELFLELREALADERDPDEALVAELLDLGADPKADPETMRDTFGWSDENSLEEDSTSHSQSESDSEPWS